MKTVASNKFQTGKLYEGGARVEGGLLGGLLLYLYGGSMEGVLGDDGRKATELG